MASVAATNPPPPSHDDGASKADDLKHIDINHLSQSELQSLSLTSNSAFDVRRTDDVVSPKLDRSLFNESAGSRRQTYSRLQHRSHSRFPGLHPSMKPQRQFYPSSDPVTHSIVHYFKHLLDGNHNPPPPPPPPPQPQQEVVAPVAELGFLGLPEGSKLKHKRVRKSKALNKKRNFDSRVGVELQKVNQKGEMVNFTELEKMGDELFSGELKKRTVGMETEEAVLGFLWSLDGQWCSRRRRRKYVDAGFFADALPVGWKLLLGLRRRDYRVSVYCRRYISPSGEHFISCREAASFLKSYFGINDVNLEREQRTCSIQQAYVMSSLNNEHPAEKSGGIACDIAVQSAAARRSSNAHGNDNQLMGIENLPEIKVQDIFECVKCNLTFDEKNVYMQHLFSYHQKTTKRYKLGTPVGEGVIIKDGKFECQFCHKVFEEKRSYSGHVGSHVRNSGKNSNELPSAGTANKTRETPLLDELPSSSAKMDALIELTKSSTVETSNIVTSEQALTKQSANVLNLEEPQAACSNVEANLSSDSIDVQTNDLKLSHDAIGSQTEDSKLRSDPIVIESENSKLSSDPLGVKVEDFTGDKSPNEHLNCISQAATENNDMTNDYQWNISSNMAANCLNDSVHVGVGEIGKYGNSNLQMDFRSNDHLEDTHTPGLHGGEIVFQDRDSSVPLAQSFDFFPSIGSASIKVEHGFSVADQKLENVTGFEELRFEDIEPFKYGYVNGQELPSLPGCSMNLGNGGRIEDGFNSSVRFHSQEVMLNTADTSQLTVCVWCRTEFRLEGFELETPSDSIGYMCPACKARISGHFGGSLSMGQHGF